MKTGTKALTVMMIVLGTLATSVLAQPAFADTITLRDRIRDRDRICGCAQICDGDGNCNCTYSYAYQHRHGDYCSGQGWTQTSSQEQFHSSHQCEEMAMERHGFSRD